MDMKENLPAPLVIKDAAALPSLVDRLKGPAFSISPPLQVGDEFLLVVCQGRSTIRLYVYPHAAGSCTGSRECPVR